jgi:hypothetical protein
VLWALAGVVANQYQDSLITSATAVVCALVIAAALIVAVRGPNASRGTGQPSRPRVV